LCPGGGGKAKWVWGRTKRQCPKNTITGVKDERPPLRGCKRKKITQNNTHRKGEEQTLRDTNVGRKKPGVETKGALRESPVRNGKHSTQRDLRKNQKKKPKAKKRRLKGGKGENRHKRRRV